MNPEDTGSKTKKDKAVSCLECRRLKLKCDRIFPCSSCRKRGVAQLCPNAALPTRSRMQLAEVVRSNATLSQMSSRIRELEVALATLQAEHYSQSHPLLDDQGTSQRPRSVESKQISPNTPLGEDLDVVHESLGTLTIDMESGKSSFFGQSAGMESLYHTDLNERGPASPGWSFEPFDPLKDYVLDPLHPKVNRQAILLRLEEYLPDPTRAWELCDLYYSNAAWLWVAIPRAQFEEDILLPIYGTTGQPSLSSPTIPHLSATILFMVFAIASLVDPTNLAGAGDHPPHFRPERPASFSSTNDDSFQSALAMASEGERYHQLARAALAAGASILEEPSLLGVRTIFLLTVYHVLLDRTQTLQMIWSHITIAVGLASSLGLHRESARWNLDENTVEERRTLFWEVYAFMSLIVGLTFGRPPQIALPFIDCEVGADPDQTIGADGEIVHGHEYRKKLMSATILSEIRDLVLNTTPPKYTEVLALDYKLRDCALKVFGGHVGARNVGPDLLKEPTTLATMQRFQNLFYKEVLILYLHRKYFVRACALSSEMLPNSLYCPSLLAAFRSAEVIILLLDSLVVLEPILSRRFGFFWSHGLASAIMVASIAIRHPQSVLAADAMRSLDTLLRLLRKSAHKSDRNDRPTKTLKIVVQLYEKAQRAMSQPQGSGPEAPRPSEELGVLAGHTRVYVSKHSASPSSNSSSASSPKEQRQLQSELHASLKEDLNMMNQHNQTHFTTTFSSQGTGLDASVTSFPQTNIDPEYAQPQAAPRLDMYTDPQGNLNVTGAPNAYFYPSEGGYPGTSEGINEIHPIFSMEPTTRSWDSMEDEMSWQGFVSGLGVNNQ